MIFRMRKSQSVVGRRRDGMQVGRVRSLFLAMKSIECDARERRHV